MKMNTKQTEKKKPLMSFWYATRRKQTHTLARHGGRRQLSQHPGATAGDWRARTGLYMETLSVNKNKTKQTKKRGRELGVGEEVALLPECLTNILKTLDLIPNTA